MTRFTRNLLSDDYLSIYLVFAAVFTVFSSAMLLIDVTHGFNESFLLDESGIKIIAVLFAAIMLISANGVYQLMINLSITFSKPMMLGFVLSEMLYSCFMLFLHR